MTSQAQRSDLKANLAMLGLFLIQLTVIASFIAGFLLGEDSIGGARYDFYLFHWPVIQNFSVLPWATAVRDYGTAMNPLLYVIASVLPLHGDKQVYHMITFFLAFLIWPLLSWAYYRRYSKYGITWSWAAFGASTILLSPSFRSSAFWGTTDYLPFVFCAGTSLLLSRFQDCEAHEARAIDPSSLVALAVISSCAFYTRQYYAFLPLCAAWSVLTRTKTPAFLVFIVFFGAMLPEMFLVYIWKGVNPPSLHGTFHPSLINIWKLGAIMGLFLLPIIAGCIRRSLSDVLPEWWGGRSSVAVLAALLAFIIALRSIEWPQEGGGIVVKAGLRMGALGTPFILTVSYFGLVAAIVFSMRSATNALLAGAFLAPFVVAAPTYQHYLEPSLAVALFLFADTQTAKTVFNKRVLICNFIASIFYLVAGIIYYDLFHHLTEIPK
jgi:hypothetical protein